MNPVYKRPGFFFPLKALHLYLPRQMKDRLLRSDILKHYSGIVCFCIFIFYFQVLAAGNEKHRSKTDSLHQLLAAEEQDTTKINLLNALALEVCKTNMDSAILLCKEIVTIAEKINNKEKAAQAYYFAGILYFLKSDYPAGINEQFKALKLAEEIKMDKFSAQILISIGNVFMMQEDYDKSLTYYHKAFNILKKLNDKNDMARTYSNIGLVYAYKKETEIALEYLQKSLEYRKEFPNEIETAITYDFIGFAYMNGSDYEKALEYLNASLVINKKLNNTIRILDNLRNRGESYLKLKRYKEAEKDLKESYELSQRHGHLSGEEGNTILLYELYKKSGKHELALQYYKRYIAAHDTLVNQENTKKILKQELNFEYAKKATADSVRVTAEKKVIAVQLKHEQQKRYALYGGLGLVALFVLFTINRIILTNRQKKIIVEQKKLVEAQKSVVDEKQKEVLDSIHYAKRIQLSLLANENYINKNLQRLKEK